MVKVLAFFKRRAGMPVQDFQAYWRNMHPEVVMKLGGVCRYVQSHTRLAAAIAQLKATFAGRSRMPAAPPAASRSGR